jgi:hypothetical protein
MMAITRMTPVLAGLLFSRETRPKTSDSVIRSAPSHCLLTQKARVHLVAPVLLEADDGRQATARNLDDGAAVLAKQLGGSGRFVQRGKVIGFWNEKERL